MLEDSKQRYMEAVRWEGKPFSVSLRKLPIPKIVHPEDAIIRVTASAICGSDLHFYRGRLEIDSITTGHESMGIVEDIGSAVSGIKIGDRVVVNSDYEQPEDNGNDIGLGSPGIANLAGRPLFQGGQAEYQLVPWAAHNLIVVPPGKDNELDYLLLSDIFPTAWYILESAEQVVGDTVAVFGAGQPFISM
jgi:threonine dehydrogenase-like Zn-dependent dehydrogenase